MSIIFAYEKKTKKKIHIKDYDDEDILCAFDHELVAKRGESRTWHYAHKSGQECRYKNNKGSFHLWWQNRIKPKYLEVRMDDHIADIYIKGLVIEIQHSPIKEDIPIREAFYKNMCWIFDAQEMDTVYIKKYKDLIFMKIIKGRKDFKKAKKDVYLDFGHQGVMKVLKCSKNYMWCQKFTMDMLDHMIFKDNLIDGADKRMDKIKYNVDQKATKDDIKEFIKFQPYI